MASLLSSLDDRSVEEAAIDVLPRLRGAFSLVFMDEGTLYAARDAQGIRPLVLGRLERGWVVASETAALDIVGASYIREVEPGEFLAIDENGLRTERFAEAQPKGCLFEYVYLARPDTTISDQRVFSVRSRSAAASLARTRSTPTSSSPCRSPARPPPSATPRRAASRSAMAWSNSYVGRTFIQPSQTIRQLGIRLKLNPLRDVIAGKRLVVVDDSIVRGNTQRALVSMLREFGASEIHVASPARRSSGLLLRHRLRFSCRADRERISVEEIRRSIGADSLGVRRPRPADRGHQRPQGQSVPCLLRRHYPIALPEDDLIGKHLLEPRDNPRPQG